MVDGSSTRREAKGALRFSASPPTAAARKRPCMSIPTPRTPIQSRPQNPSPSWRPPAGQGWTCGCCRSKATGRAGRSSRRRPRRATAASPPTANSSPIRRTRRPAPDLRQGDRRVREPLSAHHRWWRSGPVERGRQGDLLRRFRSRPALLSRPEHVTARGRRTGQAVQARHPQPLHLREPEQPPAQPGRQALSRQCPGFPRERARPPRDVELEPANRCETLNGEPELRMGCPLATFRCETAHPSTL